jgi:hypothetical protein
MRALTVQFLNIALHHDPTTPPWETLAQNARFIVRLR